MPAIHGILVQLPLPRGLDEQAVLNLIDPNKDVDGLTPVSAGRLANGHPGLVPCTPRGCLILLEDALGDLTGKRAVVIGRSVLVGRPVSQLLLRADCTVTIAHSRTRDLPGGLPRRPTCWSPPSGGRRWCVATGSSPGPRSSTSASTAFRIPIRRRPPSGKTRLVGDVAFDEASRRSRDG